MEARVEPAGRSAVRKLEPQVLPPSERTLDAFSAYDRRVLEIRLTESIECVFDPAFKESGAESFYLSAPEIEPESASANDDSTVDFIAAAPPNIRNADYERHIFLRLNYCRYRTMRVLRGLQGRQPTRSDLEELLRWEHRVLDTRSEIVRTNVPLVLAMAKRTRITGVDPADLISEGNLALLRSVDKFDCARGFKFSTYACRAILKSFSRVATRASRYRGYFPTEFDPSLEKSKHMELKRESVENDCVDELKSILGRNLANLNNVEQTVIRARFALDETTQADDGRAKTLEQVGEMIGVTKERVRQIQNKALGKLRNVLEEGILAV